MTIRTRMLFLVVPLLVAAVVVTGLFSTGAAISGSVRLSVKLMEFKSGELQKYMQNQWDLLVRNGFADQPNYVRATQRSIASFSQSLLQSPSEFVLGLDEGGAIVFSAGLPVQTQEDSAELARLRSKDRMGWIDFTVSGGSMVGEASTFAPFKWYVVVGDRLSVAFQDVRTTVVQASIVLLVSLLVGVGLLLAISRHLTAPLKEIVSKTEEIVRSTEFSRPLVIDRSDEIGRLARRFNYMASNLLAARSQLTEYAADVSLARNRVAMREAETLEVLGRAAGYRDSETAAHVRRVGLYSRVLGRLSGLDADQQDLLLHGAPLHDIGKIGVPDTILFKPGPLTPEEFETIKHHTVIGHGILRDSRSQYLRAGAAIARYHHERWDGTGYPEGLPGDDIPLFGRIVAVADTFDAVTVDRPYKKAWGFDRALALIEQESGTHFDPAIAAAMIENAGEFRDLLAENPS